ncbi:hypothetical protein [Pontixanthobacter sp.]|uniref:hypothetical protein n=1 Tax=Pontixanthobacter sp. TaxID=2792078 RepID=UPI003C7DF6B8
MFGITLKNTAKSAPISSHRTFPAVVALWFAALLGLGSLIVPVILFETMATASGVSSVIPAAAPPLGTTARLVIAAVAALLGAVAGVAIARKVAAAQRPVTADRSTKFVNTDPVDNEKPSHLLHKRPISAREELGSDCLDAPLANMDANMGEAKPSFSSVRRRSLAVTDESAPSEFLETVPLPGGDIVFDTLSENGAEDAPSDDLLGEDLRSFPEEHAPLALGDLDLTEALEDIDDPEAAYLDPGETAPAIAAADGRNGVDAPGTSSPVTFEDRAFDAPTTHASAGEPAPVSPREELAAMTNQFVNPATHTPADDARPLVQPAQPAQAVDAKTDAGTNMPVSDRALGDLGMVELIERFALALQTQKARHAAETAMAEEPVAAAPYNPFSANVPDAADIQPPVFRRSNPAPEAAEPLTLDIAAADAVAPAQNGAASGSVPSGMKPFGFDDFDEDDDDETFSDVSDLGLSLNVPPPPFSKAGAPETRDAEPNPPEAERDEAADDFSSLLAMKSSIVAKQEFVRVDADLDEPTPADPGVVFPGQSAIAQNKKPCIAFPEPEPAPAPRAFDAPAGMQAQSRQSSNGETERALKEALEKLQRMSGAA